MSPKKGQRLTCDGVDYTLQEMVGGGGAGDVWLADAQARRWAIKLLRHGTARKNTERFNREASFQEGCSHDHVVRVVGRGDHEGQQFYIMPWYPETLRGVIDRGKAETGTLLSYIQQIGEALQFAHGNGVVHRDVKPENILVDGAAAYLADFGTAHFVDSTLTSAGDLVGNRDYRAPEQRRGRDARSVGPAADVYALGLVANECFTREIPVGSNYRSIEATHPLMSYLDPIVARMLAQSPDNRPEVADILTDIRFFEAKKRAEIADINETLRVGPVAPSVDAKKRNALLQQASEDIWYATGLIRSKTREEMEPYNENWHMRLGYAADAFLVNLCVQSQLIDLCQRKFDYESNGYMRGHFYKPLDLDGDNDDRELFRQAQAIVSEHPVTADFDLSGRILKTFASCADYHCAEILEEARRVVSRVDDNLRDAPIIWIVKYLVSYVPAITGVDSVADRISISWRRSETFDQNDDDLALFTQTQPALDPGPVLEALKGLWGVFVTKNGADWCTVTFPTPDEYTRFRQYALALAEPESVFEADVMDLFRDAVCADGITQLTLSMAFDVRSTLAKILAFERTPS